MSTAHGSPATNRIGIVTSSRFILEDSRPLSKQEDGEERSGRERERGKRSSKLAVYSRPNPIQAIRRNNLAYGESVTLYPGGGALWCAASSLHLVVLTHRRALRGPSTRGQATRVSNTSPDTPGVRSLPPRRGSVRLSPSSPSLDRATGHVWGSVYSVERLVCVTSWAPLPRDLAFLPCLFRYKCETSFVRTSAASQGIYYGMRPRFEDASNGSMPIGVGCLRKVLALEVEVV